MDQHPDNPCSNALGSGVTEDDLLSAITSSGYPLQSIAVDKIVRELDKLIEVTEGEFQGRPIKYSIQEEWSYIDRDSGEARNLDALIDSHISFDSNRVYGSESAQPPGSIIRHHLDLLIECKQSELPYVFFLRPAATGEVPKLVGLPHELLSIRFHDRSDLAFTMTAYDVLGLYDLPLKRDVVTAISMSKAHRKGAKLELSGEEAFRAITLPLMKALKYYSEIVNPKSEQNLYHDIRVVIPLAILNAPMVGVQMIDGVPKIAAVPWVRLVRVDPGEDAMRTYADVTSIDVVHIDYLQQFVRMAHGAATDVMERINSFAVPVLTGEALTSPETDSDSTASRGGSGGSGNEDSRREPPPFRGMCARQSDEDFMDDWRGRMREAHSRGDSESDDAPSFHISASE